MTSPQPQRPQPSVTAGNGVEEETLHLPITTHGSTANGTPAGTAPSPYPPRPAFRAPAPAPPAGPPHGFGRPRPFPGPAPAPRPARPWKGTGFRPDIQGLRAIAVFLVLLSHIGLPFVSGGYVGVDVFFVVSGFLITSLLVEEVHRTGKLSIAGFYARRARRILPAATVVTVVTVVGAWLWFPVTRIEAVMQDAFTVIVYVVNYRFIAQETEYLNADQMPSPFQQYWSLAVEEQFYLLWPLLLVGLLLLVKRDPSRLVGAALAACGALIAVSLVLSVFTTQSSQPTAYYAAHTRIWELAAGAFLALALPALRRTPKALAWILGLAGLAAIIAAGALYSDATPFPGYTALLPVLGTMAVIAAGTAQGRNPVSSLLSTAPFQFGGKISYSLYLWHWPILILIPLAVGAEPSVLLGTVLAVGAIAVAQFSYQYIEEPFRRSRPFRTSNFAGLATGVASAVLGIAVIVAFSAGFPRVTDEDRQPVDLEAVEEVEEPSEIEDMLAAAIANTAVPENLTPSLESVEFDLPSIYEGEERSCHLDFSRTEWPDGCEFGDPDSETVVVLFGDSHAAQWFPALEPIAEQRGWKLVTRTKSSCTPVSVTMDHPQNEGEYAECDQARANVFDELDDLRPTMVIVGASETTSLYGYDSDETGPAWLDGWEATIDRLDDSAEHVVAFADTPWSEDPVPDCVGLHEDDVSACHIQESEGIRRADRREDTIELQESAGVTVIDPTGWLCFEGTCPVIVGDLLVYRDSNHMTTPYSRSLSELVAERLPEV